MPVDIVINAALREEPVNDRWWPRERERENMLERLTTPRRGMSVYQGEVRRSIPADADAYHSNLLYFLKTAWSKHLKVALAPQHLWYTLLNGLAGRVKSKPESYRALFTTSSEKQRIITLTGDPTDIDLLQIKEALVQLVPTDVGAFLPSFSTSTEASDLACLASFCDAVTPYYDYCTTLCGIPAVRLLGEKEDWRKLADATGALATLMRDVDQPYARFLREGCGPILEEVVRQFDRPDTDFMGRMFKIVACGSGHDSPVEGWLVDLFVDAPEERYKEIQDFPSHVAKVPFSNLDTNRAFDLCYGLFSSTRGEDGFFTPEFSSITYERTVQG